MINIAIFDIDNNYKGLFRTNSLADYMEDIVIGNEVISFINDCIDEETQMINYSLNNLELSKNIVKRIEFAGGNCEVILYSDDEDVDLYDAKFIGYDVCSDYYFSPLGLGLIDCEVEEPNRSNYDGIFEPLDFGVLQEYHDNLNSYRLFKNKETAEEMADYCNWLVENYENLFDSEKDFAVVKIYKVKDEKALETIIKTC